MRIFNFLVLTILSVVGLSSASLARADTAAQFDLPAQSLEKTLRAIGDRLNTNILFDPAQVRDITAPALKGNVTVEEALKRTLAGTQIKYRYMDERTISLMQSTQVPDKRTGAAGNVGMVRLAQNVPVPERSSGSAAQEQSSSEGVAEILVTGSRSRNVDIQRTEDDAQPYVVFSREEVIASQATTVEEFLRTRLPQNAGYGGSNAQQRAGLGSTYSKFNLRGLGANQTLILVNGRRLPTLNNRTEPPAQADINGIPIGSIERIEVLPSSAGGVYGGNAVGGVINIILRSDYRGLDVAATYADTSDLHASNTRLDLNGGLALEGGRTTVTFGASTSSADTLHLGDRVEFIRRGVDLYRRNVGIYAGTGSPPVGNGVNVRSADGTNLVLKPQYGATNPNLGRTFTTVPLGYAGVASDSGATLIANAGTFNLDIPDDLSGTGRGMLSAPELRSGNLNVRRQFADWIDAFIDFSHFENRGESFTATQLPNGVTLSASAANNPFQQAVRVTYPLPGFSFPYRTRSETDTLSGGAILRLPHAWAASLEYSRTWTDTSITGFSKVIPDAIQACLTSGAASCNGGPGLNPFRSPILFGPYLYTDPTLVGGPFRSTFDNPNLRLSGPLFRLPGGNAALTLSAQREATANDRSLTQSSDGTATGRTYAIVNPREQSTTSGYTEVVLPLVSPQLGIPMLRELELRGAVRHDSYHTEAPPAGSSYIGYVSGGVTYDIPGGLDSVATSDPNVQIPAYTPVVSEFNSTNFTFAGRYSPLEGVTFRGSYATGFLPPSVVQVASQTLVNPFGFQANDPLRGNEFGNYPVTQTQGQGNTALRPEESETLSFGLIVTPLKDLRFSADYTRIKKKDEIGYADTAFVLGHPELFPGRVVRGPASDGFPVGRVTTIDISAVNLLSSEVRSFDFQFDYILRTVLFGDLRLYGLASWQPHTRRQLVAAAPEVDRTGFADGPLEWQGNAGFDWTRGGLSVRWNTQLYHSYKVYLSGDTPAIAEAFRIAPQGASTIPHQSYSDLFVSYDFPEVGGMLEGVRISAGVQNIFDQTPPVVAVSSYSEASYSSYGDPRLRRFSLSLRKAFGGH